MKKVLFFLCAICSLVITSCSSDDEGSVNLAELNFSQSRYSLAKGEVEVKLISSQPATATVSIPVSFSGTAVFGTDFTAEQAITLKAGEKEAVLTIKRIDGNVGEDGKELIVNLGIAPANYKIGVGSYTSVGLLSNSGVIMSFKNATDILTLTGTYTVNLENMSGSRYKVPSAMNLAVEVDPSSTAEEGVNFEFSNGKYVAFAANTYSGSIAVKFLKAQEGKDKLVLRLVQKDGFAYGNNGICTISVNGAYQLAGTWVFDSYANQKWIADSYSGFGEGYYDEEDFPKGSSTDQITFSGSSYTSYDFTPNLKGDLKNYFTNACKATFVNEKDKSYQELSTTVQVIHRVSSYNFATVNLNFSATDTKNSAAEVGFRLIKVNNQEMLECTLDDYEPTAFLTSIYSWEQNMADYAPLRIYFKRVQ